jgi:GAG-pre-integrase domain
VEIYWNQRKNKKTINIDQSKSNVAVMWNVDGNKSYSKLANMVQRVAMDATIHGFDQDTIEDNADTTRPYNDSGNWDRISSVTNTGNQAVQISGQEVYHTHDNHSHELLEWHIRLGHMSMKRLQALAATGVLPKVLSKCKIPICAGCLHGKMTGKPWRHKGVVRHIAKDVTAPGDCVSVDQMVSSIPGLVGRIKGVPVFVDHMSDFTFENAN